MDALLEALREKTWRLKTRRKVYDRPCHTEVAWLGGSNSSLYELALRTAPCKDYEFAQLNRSVEMKRHVDGANFQGSCFSAILFNNPSLSRRVGWLPLLALRRRLLSRPLSNEAP